MTTDAAVWWIVAGMLGAGAAGLLVGVLVGIDIGRRRMTAWAGERAREVEEGRRRWASGEGIPRQRRADPSE